MNNRKQTKGRNRKQLIKANSGTKIVLNEKTGLEEKVYFSYPNRVISHLRK